MINEKQKNKTGYDVDFNKVHMTQHKRSPPESV